MNVVPVSLGWSHGGLAQSHGLVRDEVRVELSETVGSPAELEAEWRHLLG